MHSKRRHLWGFDPDIIYLNHGSFGATPLTVLEQQTADQRRYESNPMQFVAEDLQPRLAHARNSVAAFVHAEPDGLVFVPNTTTGVNTALRSIVFAPGDEILTTDLVYGGCAFAIDYIAKRFDVTVNVVNIALPMNDPMDVVDQIAGALRERTRVALIDHITSSTAIVLPIREIVTQLRAQNVITIVDGAHAPGMVEVDLIDIGADVYVANCHKWLCAAKGSAFVYADPDARDWVFPVAVGWGHDGSFTDRFDYTATIDPSPFLSVPVAIEAMDNAFDGGWPAIMKHNHELVIHGRKLLMEALDVEQTVPGSMIGSIAAIPLPDIGRAADYDDPLQRFLRTEHNIVVPITPGPGPTQRWMRPSAQIYNTIDDYLDLAAAVTGFVT